MAKSTRKGNTSSQRFISRTSGNKSPKLSAALPPTNRAKVEDRAATTAHGPDEHRSEAPRVPSHDEIAMRAHEIYLSRGASPGRDLDDWLEAERELRVR